MVSAQFAAHAFRDECIVDFSAVRFYGMEFLFVGRPQFPVFNGIMVHDLLGDNIIYFNTEEERDEHFRALEANVEKGLDRYVGFEEMYKGIDTSAPVTYIVK